MDPFKFMESDECSDCCKTQKDNEFSDGLFWPFLDDLHPLDSPSSDVCGAPSLVEMKKMSCGEDDGITGRKNKRKGKGKCKEKTKGKDQMVKRWKRKRAPVSNGNSGRGDHILRERQRRDDMSEKFTNLESILPPKPKRDRAAIVDDAINFVMKMQETLSKLEKEVLDRDFNKYLHGPQHHYSTNVHFQDVQFPSCPDIHVGCDRLTGEITIEISSDSRNNVRGGGFMTHLMKAMEEVGLDVCHCNYSKMASHSIVCILIAKQRQVCMQSTVEKIVGILHCALS